MFFASTGCFQSSAVSGVEFLGVASGGNRLGSKGAGRYNSAAAESDCKTPTRWPPMSWRRFSRIAGGACLAAGLMVSGLAASLGAEVPVQDVLLRGKVVTLAAALDAKKLGIRVDAEPTASTVVLLGEEGTITPLLSDEASRALFLDKRLQNRPAELRGKRFGGVPYFQVVTFKVEQDGKLQTPEYYCNICLALASWCAMMGRMCKIGGMVSGEIPGRGGDYPCPSIKKHAGWNTIVAVWRHTMRATDGLQTTITLGSVNDDGQAFSLGLSLQMSLPILQQDEHL